MKKKNKRILWIGVPSLLICAVVVGGSLRNRGGDLLEVQTATAERAKIVQTVNATGRIQPHTQVKISADVSAKIVNLAVVEGQWVEAGALLVELDRERYLAAVERAEASVRSAQANANLVMENLRKAESEFNRSRDLLAQALTTDAEHETIQAAFNVETARHASALDQVEQARAGLKEARDDLSKTTIYAPMSGTISDLNKEKGEIAIGAQFQEDVILVIADLSEMEAQVNVDENDIVSIEIGQQAEIEVDALLGGSLSGVVSEIANSANVSQGGSAQKTEFEVTIRITEPTASLRPGMTASADILTRTNENALSIPIQSVAVRTVDQLARVDVAKGEESDAEPFTADEDGFVEVVFCVKEGRVFARQVETGIQSDELIEITGGIEEGEEVVTGSYRAISRDLDNGSAVVVSNDGTDAT